MQYLPHAAYVAPARTRPELWRLGVGVVLGVVVFIALGVVIETVAAAGSAAGLWKATGPRGETPGGTLALLYSFATLAIAAGVAVRVIHQRPVWTLFGPLLPALRDFLRVGAALGVLYVAISVLPPWGLPEGTRPGLPPGLWALLLPLSLSATLVQVASEEIVFRGYLQQQLAARFASPVIWMGVPSILFMAIHYDPGMLGGNALAISLWAGLAGLALSDLTARSGTLGAAIAMHFFINAPTFLFLAPAGMLSGLALFVLPHGLDDTQAIGAMLPMEFVMLAITWLTARLALRR